MDIGWRRRCVPILAALLVLFTVGPVASAVARPEARPATPRGATPRHACSAAYFERDPRLGPLHLAKVGADGRELSGYRRTGRLSVAQFIATYWNPAADSGKGAWIYPPDNGYAVGAGGQPIEFQLALPPGSVIDRYGSEGGRYLSPAGLPYSMRSIPPASLNSTPAASCNYHEYEVVKSFTVDAGPIAPWFGQPGYGLQYELDPAFIKEAPASDFNVMWLVSHDYLKRVGGPNAPVTGSTAAVAGRAGWLAVHRGRRDFN